MKTEIVSIATIVACLSWAGVATAQQDNDQTLTAQVIDSEEQTLGTVTFTQAEHGVVIVADLSDLPPGPHGFHIHETGTCEPPDFQSAGGHYNPTDTAHGFDSPDGYHIGDLANLHVAEDGTARAEYFSPLLAVSSEAGEDVYTLQDDTGSAIMIHENGDDYMASTEDSTGSRIACGVIAAPQE